jgi:GntR family transcriptional regulator
MPLYARVSAQLRSRIRTGDLAIGSELPGLNEICADFGVSRITARQAVSVLADEGLVATGRGRKAVVLRNDLEGRRRLYEAVEPILTFSADHRIQILNRREVQELPPEAGFFGHAEGPYVAVRKIHLEADMPYCVTEIFVASDLFALFPPGAEAQQKLAKLAFDHAVPPIVSGRERLSVAAAEPDEADALDVPLSSPVARLCRVLCDADGRAVYFGNFSYRGDRFGSERDLTPYVKERW